MDEETLFGMVSIAEQQQRNAEAAIRELKQQIDSQHQQQTQLLAKQQKLLAEFNQLQQLAERSIKESAQRVTYQVEQQFERQIQQVVTDGLNRPLKEHLSQLERDSWPLKAFLRHGHEQMMNDHQLQLVMNEAYNQRLKRLALVMVISVIFITLVQTWMAVGWQSDQVTRLKAQQSELQQKITTMQQTTEVLAKQGGQLQLSHCGPAQQLCVQVDTTTAYGANGDYLVLKGYTK